MEATGQPVTFRVPGTYLQCHMGFGPVCHLLTHPSFIHPSTHAPFCLSHVLRSICWSSPSSTDPASCPHVLRKLLPQGRSWSLVPGGWSTFSQATLPQLAPLSPWCPLLTGPS